MLYSKLIKNLTFSLTLVFAGISNAQAMENNLNECVSFPLYMPTMLGNIYAGCYLNEGGQETILNYIDESECLNICYEEKPPIIRYPENQGEPELLVPPMIPFNPNDLV